MRTDQDISHYLLISNEVEADEEMKRLDQQLKTSFSSSPFDKHVQDHKSNIIQAFNYSQQGVDLLGLLPISDIPRSQGSAISDRFG